MEHAESVGKIDLSVLRQDGLIPCLPGATFVIPWNQGRPVVGDNVEGRGKDVEAVRLTYSIVSRRGRPSSVAYRLPVDVTACQFGDVRWWLRCPIIEHGRLCNRRCLILYLPEDTVYFGCRTCHRLTYWSQDAARDRRASS